MVRVVIALMLLLLPCSAWAEKCVALVIGNGAYTKVGALANPPRDADAIQILLRAAGFSVEVKRDLGIAGTFLTKFARLTSPRCSSRGTASR